MSDKSTGGRGPCNGQQSNGKGDKKPKFQPKKDVTDYVYYLGSSKQASDYEITTEFLINHIKKTYEYGNDIGSALEDIKPIDTTSWKPKMQVSKVR